MKLRLTKHCRERMRQRGISTRDVYDCVDFGWMVPGRDDKYMKVPHDIVVVLDSNMESVLTTYRKVPPNK